MRIGSPGCSRRSRRQAVNPSISGIITSRIKRSGRSSVHASIASTPVRVAVTAYPSSRSVRSSDWRTARSSSAMTMRRPDGTVMACSVGTSARRARGSLAALTGFSRRVAPGLTAGCENCGGASRAPPRTARGEPTKETLVNLTRKLVLGSVVAASSLSAGAIGASLVGSASAQTTGTTAPASSSSDGSSGSTSSSAPAARPDHAAETPLTGTDADKAPAAAQAAVPGATIDRVETDSDGGTYEAHVTKADGTKATVEMDANFTVTSVEADTGHGGRCHGTGGPHQAN